MQVGQDSWTFKEGAPEDVYTLAQTPDGFLWLGSPRGLFRFDPSRSQEKAGPQPITIQSVSADDKNYQLASPLTLPAGTASVEINYAAVSLSDPEAIRFRYKLQEKDKDWHEVRAASPVTYRNFLPAPIISSLPLPIPTARGQTKLQTWISPYCRPSTRQHGF